MKSPLPTFKPWKDYSTEDLQAIVQSWRSTCRCATARSAARSILESPAFQQLLDCAYQSGWQQWQAYRQQCLRAIEAELRQRESMQ
jgi:hypothetical protein